MKLYLKFETEVGPFFIGISENGRFHPIYNGESLGGYSSAKDAIEDLVMNATFSVIHARAARLLDTSRLGIPEEVSEWEQLTDDNDLSC